MQLEIRHKTQKWLAAIIDSPDPNRAAKRWLDNFNPNHYTDKTLKVEDFEIIQK